MEEEGFHNFPKACTYKHVSKCFEWDQVVLMACAAYIFLPNEHSKESPFFLMFGRDPIVPLNSLLMTTVRYSGTDENLLSLDALRNMDQLIASNVKQDQKDRDNKGPVPVGKRSEGDSILLMDHTAGVWDSRYIRDCWIVCIPGRTQVEVVDSKG